jgi:phage terminase large subunit GpA-like protein
MIDEAEKDAMIAAGEWVVTNPMAETRGYHLNALYSPFVRWATLAREWQEAQGNPDALQVFVNTALGEEWEDRAAQDLQDVVQMRAQPYEPEGATWRVPRHACVLVCGVDKQDAELHYVVRAYGPGEQSWLIDWGIFRGDTSRPEVWAALDEWRQTRTWRHEGGALLKIRAMCIDSGDDPDPVYTFTRSRLPEYVFAIKGAADPNADILPKKFTKTRAKSRLYLIGTQAIKKRLFRRAGLNAPEPYTLDAGPTFMHFNERADGVYFAEFFSQKLVRHTYRGRTVSLYVKRSGERDEKLDCEVYAYAALQLGPVSIPALQSEWERVMAEGEHEGTREGPRERGPRPPAVEAAPRPRATPAPTSTWIPRRPGGWMRG